MVLRLEPTWEMISKCHMDDIIYWTWLNHSVIGIVTEKYVFHWDIDGGRLYNILLRAVPFKIARGVGLKLFNPPFPQNQIFLNHPPPKKKSDFCFFPHSR